LGSIFILCIAFTLLNTASTKAEPSSAQAKTIEKTESNLKTQCLNTCLSSPEQINGCNTRELIETYLRESINDQTGEKK
jgi:hypothetical protein